MSIIQRWNILMQESGGSLPSQLKQFQLDTQTLLESGKNVLVSVPTGQGKSLIQLNSSRLMGGEQY
jgi:replicative superfamily II helicase